MQRRMYVEDRREEIGVALVAIYAFNNCLYINVYV